jgi:DNA-binding transcriptional MerR regulator
MNYRSPVVVIARPDGGIGLPEHTEFLEYLKLQGSLDMCTKTEILEELRSSGVAVSPRQLTTYITEGLLPKSARVGRRSGVYPRIIVDLLHWIERSRRRGLSLEAIKQLVPVWRFVRAALNARNFDLNEFQDVAEREISSEEAAFALPSLLMSCLPCPEHEKDAYQALVETKFVLKDGTNVTHTSADPVTIGFTISDANAGSTCPIASTRLAIPTPLTEEQLSRSTVAISVACATERESHNQSIPPGPRRSRKRGGA